MNYRAYKKWKARRAARFHKEYRRRFDRHDRYGRPVDNQLVEHDVTYELDKGSTLLADPPTVVMPVSGSGRWIRTERGSKRWARQATWSIDPTTGADEISSGDRYGKPW
jgi:hypothetical protein